MIAIALAVGLGVGLTRRSEAHSIGSPGGTGTSGTPIIVSNVVPFAASQPVPEAFVSFAIEFGHFPDFAGELIYLKGVFVWLTFARKSIQPKHIF